MKKRIFLIPIVFALMLSNLPVVNAASVSNEVIYSDDKYTITLTALEQFGGARDAVYPFSEGYAVAYIASEGKTVIIDKTGSIVDMPDSWYGFGGVNSASGYNSVFSEGLIFAQNTDGRCGYIDINGNLKAPANYERGYGFNEGLAVVVTQGGAYGAINKTGSVIIPANYYWLGGFNEGLCPAQRGYDTGCGYIDTEGNVVIEFNSSWAWAGKFSEGLARVRNTEGKYGFINTSGEVVIPFMYKNAGSFSEGLAWVIDRDVISYYDKEATTYYIEKSGEMAIETLGYCSEFRDGIAETAAGYIDKTGKVLIPGGTELSNGVQFSFGRNPYSSSLGSAGFIGRLAVERVFGPFKWCVLELIVNSEEMTPESPAQSDASSDWATEDVTAAIAAGLVPDSIANAGWQNATTRLAAADALALVIEKSLGNTMDEIAAEKGWDLSVPFFSDTDSKAVSFLGYAGVTTGIGDNKYGPDGEYNRAQMVTMIGRAAETMLGADVQGDNPFTDDVPDWAAPYVGYAADAGITTGISATEFGSYNVLQNQQTAIFCLRTHDVFDG